MHGAAVWDCPFGLAEADSADLNGFVGRFLGSEGRVIRLLTDKMLYASEDRTQDSILAIVGEALNVEPKTLQRQIPSRFRLLWGLGLSMDIRTGIPARPGMEPGSLLLEAALALNRSLGGREVRLTLKPEDALTLYHAVESGTPTLLRPP